MGSAAQSKTATQALQFQFAGHIRNPEGISCPSDVPDRRMNIYRELFYNNIESFISSAFPVLRQIISDDDWHAMVRDFLINHRCKTPYFPEISEEFLEYIQLHRQAAESDPPFMVELAHYEWVELALDISSEEIPADSVSTDSDEQLETALLDHHLQISPVAWNLSYHWPVQKLAPDFQPTEPPETPTYMLVYRNRADQIKFMEMNPVTARLVSIIKEEQVSGQESLEKIAHELEGVVERNAVFRGGIETLKHLREVDAVVIL